MYVLQLFVRVPPSVTAPVTYTPIEVDAINQVADGRKRATNRRSKHWRERLDKPAKREARLFQRENVRWGCPGCGYLRTGQWRQQAHSEACRRRIEGLLKGDPTGSARLRLMKESIVHWLMQLSGTRPRIQE